MSLLKKISLGFLLLVLLLIMTLAFLLGTSTGLHIVINSAARWVPGLEINEVTGGWRGLTLKGLKYQMPGILVDVGQFDLALDLSCLRRSELCVNALAAQDVNVTVNSAEMPPSAPATQYSQPLTDLSTPYPINLRKLALNNVNITVDGTGLSLGEFSSGAYWQERGLTLQPTTFKSLLITLPPPPEAKQPAVVAKATDEKPLAEILQALFAKPLLADLPEIHLPLDITLPELRAEQIRVIGATDVVIDSLQLGVSTKGKHLQLEQFALNSPQGMLFAQGQATLAERWPVEMTVNSTLNVAPLKGEKLKLTIGGELRNTLQIALNLSGPVSAQLDLQARLAEAGLPIELTLQSKQLKWPLTGQVEYEVNDFNLRLSGKMADYTLSTRANIKGQNLPPAMLLLNGKGNLAQFKLERLRLSALEGNADLSGLIDWSKAVSWTSQLTLTGIDTAKQWPEWPARLDGKMSTRGSFDRGSWQLQVPELQLSGNVKKNIISARGSLSGNAAGQWSIPGIELALGRNTLNIKGRLDEKSWQLDGDIDAQHLKGALPGLAGNVTGQLRLRGNPQSPQLVTELNAKGLRWRGLRIQQLSVNGNVRAEEQIQGQLAVRLEKLKKNELAVDLLTLDVRGNERQHRLALRINGKPVSGELALEGRFDRQQQRWLGNLHNTRFDTPVKEWRLANAITLDYQHTQQRLTIGSHCWVNPDAELCVPRSIQAGASGQASVVLKRFDLRMLTPFLGFDTAMSGGFTGSADVSWQPDGKLPQARISLVGNAVKIVQQIQGSALPISFDALNLNANLNNDRLQTDWLIKLAKNGQFDGNIQIDDLQVRRAISGKMNISDISLALLKPILERGEKATGVLNGKLQLRGTAQAPLVFGRLALEKVSVISNLIPFDITEGHLILKFRGMTSTLEGLLTTGHGKLALTGGGDWQRPDDWRAHIAAKGDRVRVTLPPIVRIDVSPDLLFEATPRLFSLSGSVDIPWARISVQQLPDTAVGISPDEVMLNKRLKPVESRSTGIPISSNLVVTVGDDVSLDAFGLNAQLRGNLRVLQDNNTLGLNGQIDIPSGSFRAYGQDLIVRKGQLLFSGPADQPLLNIEAIRNPNSVENNVTVGVRVTGMADVPRVEIFSDPAMSQEEALSYLLRGQGLGSGGADSNLMTSMLIGMGVAQSGQLVGKIGEALGVSNLTLNTEGVGDNYQVVVSGYILPDLQVKYGIGIFDSLATLTLRYRLMPRLYLEAVSGLDQALDLLYQFEF